MTRIWPQQPGALLIGASSDAIVGLLRQTLADNGHQDLVVVSTAEALAMIGGTQRELLVVVSDQLPFHQAESLIHEALQAPQGCAVIALAADSDQVLGAERLIAGADELLTLPTEAPTLRRSIDRAWLRCRRRHAELRPLPARSLLALGSRGGSDEAERLHAELVRSQAALGAALEATDLGLAEVDLQDLRILTANKRLWRLLGGPDGRPLQLPLPDLAITTDRGRIAAACAEAECFGRRVDLADIRCDVPGHHMMVLDLCILPVVVDGLSAPLAMVSFREVEVERGADPSQPLDSALEFAAAATHDLMAPLQTLAGYLDLLADDAKHGLEDGDREMILRALRATASMRGTIVDMLAWARTGSLSGSSAAFPLDRAVEQSLANLAGEIGSTRIVHDLRDLPPVHASAGIVSRVIQNLVMNALRFVPTDTGQIEIAATVDPALDQIVVTVADNGSGVLPEDRDKIFQLFHTDGGGLGIGLAFCRRAIRACGGEIWLEPDPGGGARFRFSLPLATSSTCGAPPPSEPTGEGAA